MRRTAAALALALLLPLPGLAGEVVVKPGETLSEIAERYGTTVDRLMQLNGLRSPQDLWAGSRIQVPGAGRGSGGGRGGGASGSGNYTVKTGETLSEIAERYGTTVDRLMQLNDLRSPQDLWAGSRIQVPGASAPSRPASASPPVNRNAREHRVQPGETLSEIAALYGIPMSRLVALNGLSQPNNVQAGTTLRLRGTPTSTANTRATNPPGRSNAPTAATTSASRPPASTPKPSTSPTAAAAARPTATTPATPAARPSTTATATATAATTTPAARPSTTTVRPSTTTVAAASATATARKPATPDWRSYGPLQVDWANWQPMAGSYVAPSLNSGGQPLYLAVNCSARRLNATDPSGTWKTWDAPQNDSEHKLINDLCTAKGG